MPAKKILLKVSTIAAIILVAFVFIFLFRFQLQIAYELVMLRLLPSAERAYVYGERHFDTTDPAMYNIGLADRFFMHVVRLDPKYPYGNHQLARTQFLQSHFHQAMFYIDRQIAIFGTSTPNSYYVRGLIEGYMDNYSDAAKDYQVYVDSDPTNWAATNDLAWVLLKDNRPKEALEAIDKILPLWLENPWLLNSKATALYELKRYKEAKVAVDAAAKAVVLVSGSEWSHAYPGNDPQIGQEGADAFKEAVFKNMHTITLALQKGS